MYNSGDAAEQIVRISLEGTEVALKLTGSAAKNIAAMIYTVLKNRDKNKTKGRQRLTAMLKSGKELKVFTVSEEHLKQFAAEAKRYGVVYCALRGKEKSADGMVDIMVRAEDASKINRIVERFKLAAVDTVSIKRDIEKSKAEKTAAPFAPEQEKPDKEADDRLLDDLMGVPVKRRNERRRIPKSAKMILLGKRRRNPIRPRLSQRSKTEPPRVLLSRPKNAPLFVKNCGKSRRNSKRRRLPPKKNPSFQKSRPNSRRPPTNNRPEKRNPNQRRDNP